MALVFVITAAGRAALVNAAHDGSNAVRIAQAGVSATAIVPTPDLTAIPDEIKRVPTVSGAVVAADTIHLVIEDSSADAYTVRSVALYLTDGTLFGVYGQADPLLSKTAQSLMLLAADLQFADVAAAQISFGDTNFFNPPATTSVHGVVELATDQEAIAGTDEQRAVTPGGMWAAVSTWLDARFGSGAPSPFVKGLLVSASAVAMRISLGLKSAATFDAGPGNGLDADTVDGRQAAELALLSGAAFAGNITRAGNKVWDAGNDGAGSGLDADLLDGVDSSAFAKLSGAAFTGPVSVSTNGNTQALAVIDAGINGANLRLTGDGATPSKTLRVHSGNLEVINSAYTAPIFQINDAGAASFFGPLNRSGSSIWDAGNDGAGSGLDADLLDGNDSNYFTNIAARLGYTPVNRAGDTMLGGLSFSSVHTSEKHLEFSRNGQVAYIYGNAAAVGLYDTQYGSIWNWTYGGSFYIQNGLAWHAGNDGAGSGLDADLLDGFDSSTFAKLSGASFAGAVYAPNIISTGGSLVARGTSGGEGGQLVLGYAGSNAIGGQANSTWNLDVDSGSSIRLFKQRGDGSIQFVFTVTEASQAVQFNVTPAVSGNAIWHAANDGSGSGLDADLLDGFDSSAFLKTNDGATYGSNAQGEWEKRANGLIEQWGEILFTSTIEPVLTVTLPIGMSDATYKVQLTPLLNSSNTSADTWVQLIRSSRTTNQFQVQYQHPGSTSTYDLDGFQWRIIGK